MSSPTANSILSNKVPVLPSEIQSELKKIWRQAAEAEKDIDFATDKKFHTRVKATLSNILALTTIDQPSTSPEVLSQIVRALAIKHPSRFFLLELAESGNKITGLRTAVSSQCVLAQSGAHICSEEVYIATSPSREKDTTNLVLSLLSPDAQSIFLMLCDPAISSAAPSNKVGHTASEQRATEFTLLSSELERLSDLIVLDSRIFSSYHSSMAQVDLMEKNFSSQGQEIELFSSYGNSGNSRSFKQKIRDLNWIRIKRWQKLIAEQFRSKVVSNSLPQLEQITIECNLNKPELELGNIPSKALLILSWIAESLDMTVETNNFVSDNLLHFKDSTGRLDFPVRIFPQKVESTEEQPFKLSSIEFSFGNDAPTSSLRIARQASDSSATIEVNFKTGNSNCRRVPFPEISYEDLLLASIVCGTELDSYRRLSLGARAIAKMVDANS
ncbi:hypothetical protein BVY02_00945 [bacterium J17]|nr:hypothetical protein BVY02_00945 [bacterium J17]